MQAINVEAISPKVKGITIETVPAGVRVHPAEPLVLPSSNIMVTVDPNRQGIAQFDQFPGGTLQPGIVAARARGQQQ